MEVRGSVSMGDGAVGARSAEAPVSVSMGASAAGARSAEAPVSVSTGESAASARSAEAPVSVSMGDSAPAARSAEAPRGNTQSRRRTALVRRESSRRTGWPVHMGVRSWHSHCLRKRRTSTSVQTCLHAHVAK